MNPFRPQVIILAIAAFFNVGSAAQAQTPSGGPASPERPPDVQAAYTSVEASFLQEDFQQVATLAPVALRSFPFQAHTARIWLWYIFSLERLQRVSDALHEIDRLKDALTAPQSPQGVGAKTIWPEVLFWEGEISRKAMEMLRARLAYQRLLKDYPTSSWATQARLGLGSVLLSEQAYDAAAAQFREVASHDLTSGMGRQAALLESLCYLRAGRPSNTEGRLTQLLALHVEPEETAQAMLYLAEALTAMRRFEEGERAYQRVIAQGQQSVWVQAAYFGLGWSYFQQDRCRDSLQAMAKYESLASAFPTSHEQGGDTPPELLLVKGRCLVGAGDETTAKRMLETLYAQLGRQPLAIDAGIALAELAEHHGQVPEARRILEALRSRTRLATQRGQIILRLGSLALVDGEVTEAIRQFVHVYQLGDAELRQAALNGLGDAQRMLGRRMEAMDFFDEARRVDPAARAGLYATYQLGRLRLESGAIEDAIRCFDLVVTSDDSLLAMEGRIGLAFAYLSSGHPDAARNELDDIRAEVPGSPQAARAAYYLAILEVREGHLPAARRLCEETIRILPRSEEAGEAHILIAELLTSQDSLDAAIDYLRGILETSRTLTLQQQAVLAAKLAGFARQQHAYAEAIRWYEVAWRDAPGRRSELEYRLASCYEEGGDTPLAIQRYRAISEVPWKIRGELAAAKLLEREGRLLDATALYRLISAGPSSEAKIAAERLRALQDEQDQEAGHAAPLRAMGRGPR